MQLDDPSHSKSNCSDRTFVQDQKWPNRRIGRILYLNKNIQANHGTQASSDWIALPNRQKRFVHLWTPHIEPRAQVTIIHGLGEHGGRYIRLAPHLARQGYCVAAFDLPGHGRHPGKRGAIASYSSLIDELEQILEWSEQQRKGLPVFLFGHSMGGNLVVNYLLRRNMLPQAAIASSPMFVSPKEPKGLFNIAARCLLRVAPNYTLSAGIETKQLMDDPAEQQILDNDPLFHRRLTLRLAAALVDSGRWAIENANRLRTPLLITHGQLDRVTLPEGSEEFARKAGPNCRLELLTDHLHESFRDQRRHQVIQLYLDFLASNLVS